MRLRLLRLMLIRCGTSKCCRSTGFEYKTGRIMHTVLLVLKLSSTSTVCPSNAQPRIAYLHQICNVRLGCLAISSYLQDIECLQKTVI